MPPCQGKGSSPAASSSTHIIQRIALIRHLHSLHTRLHPFFDLHFPGDGYLAKTKHPFAGLVEFRDEIDGEIRAGVDAGADAEVDRGTGPWVSGFEDEGTAGEGPGGTIGG